MTPSPDDWDCPWCRARHAEAERRCVVTSRTRLATPLARRHLKILLRGCPGDAAPLILEAYLDEGPVAVAYILGIAFCYDDWHAAFQLVWRNFADLRYQLPLFWYHQAAAARLRRKHSHASHVYLLRDEIESGRGSSRFGGYKYRPPGWGPDWEWPDNPYDGPARKDY
jgi:hypothetical protein